MSQQSFHQKLTLYDQENAYCVDCNSPNPQFASINNGVLVCWSCSIEHEKLGYQISYIRDINLDWDGYLFSFIRHGGNTKFKQLLDEYSIENLSIREKYNLNCVDYHRKHLKAKLSAKELPIKPSVNEGREPLIPLQDDYPEFADYQFVVLNTIGVEVPSQKNESFPGQLLNFFEGIGDKVIRSNKVLANKFKKTKIADKIKIGTNVTVDHFKKAGSFIADKSQPALKFTQSKIVLLTDKIIGNHPTKECEENNLGAPTDSTVKDLDINSQTP